MLDWTGERYVPWFEGAEIGYEHLHRYAFATLFVRNKRVLDLACGEGYGSNLLSQTAKQVVGIDIDEQAIKHATNKYIKPNLQFKIGNITKVPIGKTRVFDVIVCFEALEHVDDHQRLLSEAKRLLVPDGILLASTPNKTLYTDESRFNNPFHVHELYFDEFKGLLESYFRQVKFLGQRIYCNSSMWPIFPEKRNHSSEFVIEKTPKEFSLVQPEKRAPLYFIAVASNSAKNIGGHVSLLVDISNELVGERDRTIQRVTAERDDLQKTEIRLEESLGQKEQQVAGLNEVIRKTQDRFTQDMATLQSVIAEKEEEISRLGEGLSRQVAILDSIHVSHAWKVVTFYYRVRDRLLPEGTFRRDLARAFFRTILAFRSILRSRKVSSDSAVQEERLWTAVQHEQSASDIRDPQLPASNAAETNSQINEDENQHYQALSGRISALQRSRIESLQLKAPELISINEAEFESAAQALIFPRRDKIQVSIIIPVFNNLKFTLECLTSVLKYSFGVPYEVIVVDDASTDRTAEVLSKASHIVYLKNKKNLGFVHACNLGASQAKGKYLLFLNNDAQVTEDWLQSLVNTFEEHENVGAAGPKILFPDGRLQEAGAVVNRDGTSRLIGVFDDPNLPRYNYAREVMYCSGSCLLVESRMFKELGGFDAGLAPAYCEDWDLAFRLREQGRRILYNPRSLVVHHLSATSTDFEPDFKTACVVGHQQKLCERWQREIDRLNDIRLIAFYLPQFHPIPENDYWWGKGFTDWANVAKARPNYVGHYQPHLPADLGFYDLRVEEVMNQQAELAKRYGLYGFCYFYYWFAGKRLLDLPIERMLKTNRPNHRFCIAWANENWTRSWDGLDHEVLIGQQHSDDDDRAVIRDMIRYFRHPNYIRIHDKPLLLVYRINLFPDIQRTTEIWREQCLQEGIGDIYLALVESFENAIALVDPAVFGFDASVEFPPHGMDFPMDEPAVLNPDYNGKVHDYREAVLKYIQLEIPSHVRFRSVMPSWDNTPRRQNSPQVFEHARPGTYQAWLEAILDQTHEQNFGEERIAFINAWNEWGEGNHLEPDKRFGHGFLEATRNAQEAWLLQPAGAST